MTEHINFEGMAEIARGLAESEATSIKVHTAALHDAVMLSHELPPALTVAPPPEWDGKGDGDLLTATDADMMNERARAVEHATVARTLRMAEQFANYIRTGLSIETRAQLGLPLDASDYKGLEDGGG